MNAVNAHHLQPERIPSGVFFRSEQLGEGSDLTELFEKGIEPYSFPAFPVHDGGYSPPTGNVSRSAEYQTPSYEEDVRCLPLLDVNIEVDVKFTVARTRVLQKFTNLSSLVIKEANYSF